MVCIGQLRFGPAGQGAASTVALVVPCTELVRDERGDDTVDVAVGTAFRDVNPRGRSATRSTSSAAAGSGTTAPANADPAARQRVLRPRRRWSTRPRSPQPATPRPARG